MDLVVNRLQNIFHHQTFQEGQEPIIRDILAGKDVLGVLPTGSGKSLCYQLPATILPGLTIVISPLISLMIDQVRQIKAYHFKEVAALHSFQQFDERKTILTDITKYKLLFLSPELLQQAEIISVLKRVKTSLICIDEAHCISQWGYDFRPDYLRLHSVIQALESPTVLALTGTATPQIQQDIIRHLQTPEMTSYIYSMEKKNMTFVVEECAGTESEKKERLAHYAEQFKKPALVYFSSRNKAEEMASYLAENTQIGRVTFYHAGMQAEDRLKIQEQFIYDQLDVICCTSAFGMGINKANIRTVIHYHPPAQLESFLQEVGRAGRDGNDCISVLLYRESDLNIPLSMIDNELPEQHELATVFRKLKEMQIEGKQLPKNKETLASLFELSETKWRILHYQLELHHILDRKYQISLFETAKWHHILGKIQSFCQNRRRYKRKKMQEMILWLKSESCLRQSLYKPFEEEVAPMSNQCCSNCGWEENNFFQQPTMTHNATERNWQNSLKKILLFEELYEAKSK